MNIYEKLAKIRKPVEVMQKNRSGYNYMYVTEDEILAKITGLMTKHNVSLIPEIKSGTLTVTPYHYVKRKRAKNGSVVDTDVNDLIVTADMVWKWVNNEDPSEVIEVPWAMTGQQEDTSRAFGSGLTYASRYFLLKYFNVATTDDDPDNWRSKQKEAEVHEDAMIAKNIIEDVHKIVNEFVATNEDKRPEITNIVKKYVKKATGKSSNNYFDIKSPDVAAELSDEITKFIRS